MDVLLCCTRTGSAALMAALIVGLGAGCSIKRVAVNTVGDALAASGATFASDNDPALIQDAAPFSLKLMETLLVENPGHRGLLLAVTRGFTQYSFAFVQQEADRWRYESLEKSDAYAARARNLYLRARDYGLRGLELAAPGFEEALRKDPHQAVRAFSKDETPFLFWTAASWAAAIALSKTDPALIGDQPQMEALIYRALELDEAFDRGAIHTFLIGYEMARTGAPGEAVERATRHYERAMKLTEGLSAAPLVAMAELVAVQQQRRDQFESLLKRALAIDPDAFPKARLINLILQERARWLLTRIDDLFLPLTPE